MSDLLVRGSTAADTIPISLIYAHHVKHGAATFEITPPDAEEIAQRRQAVLDQGLPYLVAECGGVVAGYAYAALYDATGLPAHH